MNKEDYNKFYIQGSDHYLIPKDVFDELFDEMKSWKKENQKLKVELQLYQGALKREYESIHRVNELEEVIDKIKEYIQKIFYFNEETGEYALLHTFDKCNAKELLDILNEVSE